MHAKSVNPPPAPVRPTPEITVGTVFRIKGNAYRGKVFTCARVDAAISPYSYTHLCDCGDGTDYWFNRSQFAYYGVEIFDGSPEAG
jgi:hypothetical protein